MKQYKQSVDFFNLALQIDENFEKALYNRSECHF